MHQELNVANSAAVDLYVYGIVTGRCSLAATFAIDFLARDQGRLDGGEVHPAAVDLGLDPANELTREGLVPGRVSNLDERLFLPVVSRVRVVVERVAEADGEFAFIALRAKAKIDERFTGDKVDLNNVRFEIEGYTDNLGSFELNHQVGLARAEAVKQYLGEQYEIPADWISVVSYGMENPVADNSTPEGRARNRRVVIKVVD